MEEYDPSVLHGSVHEDSGSENDGVRTYRDHLLKKAENLEKEASRIRADADNEPDPEEWKQVMSDHLLKIGRSYDRLSKPELKLFLALEVYFAEIKADRDKALSFLKSGADTKLGISRCTGKSRTTLTKPQASQYIEILSSEYKSNNPYDVIEKQKEIINDQSIRIGAMESRDAEYAKLLLRQSDFDSELLSKQKEIDNVRKQSASRAKQIDELNREVAELRQKISRLEKRIRELGG